MLTWGLASSLWAQSKLEQTPPSRPQAWVSSALRDLGPPAP